MRFASALSTGCFVKVHCVPEKNLCLCLIDLHTAMLHAIETLYIE